MTKKPLEYYIDRYTNGTITREEWLELRMLLDQPEYADQFDKLIDQQLLETEPGAGNFPAVTQRVVKAVEVAMNNEQEEPPAVVHRIHPFRRWWWAAASVILLLGAGIYFIMNSTNKVEPVTTVQPAPNDALPGRNGAILTLADGRKVVIDSVSNGMIAQQNGSQVNLENGRLTYDPTGTASGTITYNTMATPRGRQFQLQLPDGTKVWLNAASSISYPTVFSGKKREVTMTGEAYFDVAKNAKMPFVVRANDKAAIEVLGTHFNVDAYDNNAMLSTTLLEGSIKVNGTRIKPGQQALIADVVRVVNNADTSKVLAWKNGLFNFEGAKLEEVMKQLERWYDIEVVYEKGIPDLEFGGEMTKNIPLSGLLLALEKSDIHFRLEGRKLVVLP